jgi:hypothetical protein
LIRIIRPDFAIACPLRELFMTTPSNQPVEKTEVEKQQTPEKIQSAATDRTLAQAVVEARDTSRPLPASIHQPTDTGAVATATRPTQLTMAEHALDAHLNGTDNLQPISRVAEENFARTNVGSSSFEARQYVVQANMADSRPSVETVKLNAGGQEYQGFRYMNPESGKEYFYANDAQHAGQRFELTKSETGYAGLKQLGGDGQNRTIPITREPSPTTAFRGDGELGSARPAADSSVQFRPQPMSAPQGERQAPAAPDKPVSINPQLLSQIKTQLESNPRMVDELQRQADKDWRAAAILKELGYQRPEGTAAGGAPRPDQQQTAARSEQQQTRTEPRQEQQQPARVEQQQPARVEQQQPARVEQQPPARVEQQPPARVEQQQPVRVEQQQPTRAQEQIQKAPEGPRVTPVEGNRQGQQQPAREQSDGQPKFVQPQPREAGRPAGEPQIKPVETVLQGKAQVDIVRPPTAHDAAQTQGNKPPQTLDTLVATRLGDQTSRQAAVDALQLAQKGKVPGDGDAQQTMRLQQLVQNIGPDAFGRLRTMIQDQTNANTPLRLDGKFDPVTAARLRDFLDLTLSGTLRRPVDGTTGDGTTTNFSTMARNSELIGRNLGDQQSGSAAARDFAAIGGAAIGGAMLGDLLNRGRPPQPADPVAAQRPDAVRPEPRLQPPEAIRQDALRPDASAPELRPEIKPDSARNDVADRQTKEDSHIAHTSEIAAATANAANNPAQSELDLKGQIRPEKERDEKLKEDEARRQKEDEETRLRKAEDEARKQREQAESAAIMAMLAGKKGPRDAREAEEEAAAEKAKRDQEKRLKYIVKEGDTLESIASKMLRDKQLAGLIYDINKTIIPSKMEGGRTVPALKVGLVIWLPTAQDIKDYRVKLMTGALKGAPAPGGAAPAGAKFANAEEELSARFGSNWDAGTPGGTPPAPQTAPVPVTRSAIPPAPLPGVVPGTTPSAQDDSIAEGLDDAARQAYATRRQNVENMLGPLTKKPEELKPRYVVRLGDTLKSIAMKHPALNDVKLWRLLAEVNGLSTGVDEKGNPLVPLKRGQVLSLPMQEEVDAFLGTTPVPKDEPPNSVPDLDVSYTGVKAVASGSEPAKTRKQRVSSHKLKAVEPCEPGYKVLNQRSASSRVLQAGDPKNLDGGFILRLESKQGDVWVPVVVYEIYNDVSLRHEYKLSGDRRTIRIDLPAPAAVELAQNDITSNWTNYCLKFNKK